MALTNDQLTMTLQVDSSGAVKGFVDAAGAADGYASSAKKAGDQNDNASKTFSSLGGAIIVANQAIELAKAAWSALAQPIGAAIEAYIEAEAASKGLQSVLKLTVKDVDTSMQRFEALAKELEKTTIADDDLVLALAKQGKALGFTNDRTEQLIRTSLNMSAAIGVDVTTAFEQLSGVANGVTGRLAKIAPELNTLTKAQLTAGGGVDILSQKFDGFSSTALDTLSGKLAKASQEFHNFQEDVGQVFVEMFNVAGGANSKLEFFGNLRKDLAEIKPDLLELGKIIQDIFGVFLSVFKTMLTGFAAIAKLLSQSIDNVASRVAVLANAFSKLIGGDFGGAVDALKNFNSLLDDTNKLVTNVSKNANVSSFVGPPAPEQAAANPDPELVRKFEAEWEKVKETRNQIALIGKDDLQKSFISEQQRIKEINDLQEKLSKQQKLSAEQKKQFDTLRSLAHSQAELSRAEALRLKNAQSFAPLSQEQLKLVNDSAQAADDLAKKQELQGLTQLQTAQKIHDMKIAELDTTIAILEAQKATTTDLQKAAEIQDLINKAKKGKEGAEAQLTQTNKTAQGAFSPEVAGAADALGGFAADLSSALTPITAIMGAANAIVGALQAVIDFVPQILDSVAHLFNSLTDLPNQIQRALSGLLSSIINLVSNLIPNLVKQIPQMISDLIKFAFEQLPRAIEQLLLSIPSLLDKLLKSLDVLIPKFVSGFISNAPKLAIALGIGFIKNVPKIIMSLVKNMPVVAKALIQGILDGLSSIVDAIGSIFSGEDVFGGEEAATAVNEAAANIQRSFSGVNDALFSVIDFQEAGAQTRAQNITDAQVEGAKKSSSIWRQTIEFFKKIWDGIVFVFNTAIQFLKDVWDAAVMLFQGAVKLLELVWNAAISVLKVVVDFIAAVFDAAAAELRAIWESVKILFDTIIQAFVNLWETVKTLFFDIINVFKALWDFVKEVFMVPIRLFQAMWDFVKTLFDNPIQAFKNLWQSIKDIFGGVFDKFGAVFDKIGTMFGNAIEGLKNVFSGLWDGLKSIGSKLWEGLKEALGKIGSFFKDLFTFDGGGTGTVEDFLGFDFPFLAFAGGGQVPGYANSPGDSSKNDVVPALLSPGEMVMPRSIVQNDAYRGVLDAMFQGKPVQKFNWFEDAVDAIASGASEVADFIVPDWAQDLYDSISRYVSNIDIKNLILHPIDTLESAIKSGIGNFQEFFRDMMHFQEGGFVPSGTDTVPAMLTPGEFVMNRGTVNRLGAGALSSLNNGGSLGGMTTNMTVNVDITTTQPIDESFIKNRLMPSISQELKRASLDGRFVLSSNGLRKT